MSPLLGHSTLECLGPSVRPGERSEPKLLD